MKLLESAREVCVVRVDSRRSADCAILCIVNSAVCLLLIPGQLLRSTTQLLERLTSTLSQPAVLREVMHSRA